VAGGLLYWAWYLWKNPWLTLRFSQEGLWIQKHKIVIPWECIESADFICPSDRKSSTEQIAESMIKSMAGASRINGIFIAIVLTEAGRTRFENKDFIGKMTRKLLKLHEDILISPRDIPLSQLRDVVATIQQESNKAKMQIS
jgi:hypothetical protein